MNLITQRIFPWILCCNQTCCTIQISFKPWLHFPNRYTNYYINQQCNVIHRYTNIIFKKLYQYTARWKSRCKLKKLLYLYQAQETTNWSNVLTTRLQNFQCRIKRYLLIHCSLKVVQHKSLESSTIKLRWS